MPEGITPEIEAGLIKIRSAQARGDKALEVLKDPSRAVIIPPQCPLMGEPPADPLVQGCRRRALSHDRLSVQWKGWGTGDPHNQFLKIWGEQGIVGLIAFLFFIYRALAFPALMPYRQLAGAVLVGWCATSLANSDFSTFAEGHLIFFWVGAMLGGQPTAGANSPA